MIDAKYKDGLIYLASPYSKCSLGIEEAYEEVEKVLHHLTGEGFIVFCPIVHCHHMAVKYGLPKTWDFWKRIDFTYIRKSDCLVVAKLPDWDTSTGVTEERAFAKSLDLPVEFVDMIK
jgi:hypothetical protein